jgi:hypothetical protein
VEPIFLSETFCGSTALKQKQKRSCEEVKPRTIHRKALLQVLAEELPPGSIRFSSKLVSVDTEPAAGEESSETAVVRLDDGTVVRAKVQHWNELLAQQRPCVCRRPAVCQSNWCAYLSPYARCQVLIGCDGVHSVVARWLGMSEPVSSGRSCVRGLSVFPDGHRSRGELRQFLSEGLRAGMVPISDTDVYYFLVNNTVPAGKLSSVVLLSVSKNLTPKRNKIHLQRKKQQGTM